MNNNAIQFHDQLADRWEAKYRKASFRRREEILDLALAAAAAAPAPAAADLTGQRWLDAGCGSGRLARALARRGAGVIGIDGSTQMIRVARELASSELFASPPQFEQLEIMQIAQQGQRFDGVLCNSVIEYLDDPEGAVAACAACLRAGGRLLMSVPNRRSLLRKCLLLAHRVTGRPAYLKLSKNQYDRETFERLLARHGLFVDRALFFGGPLPRWLQRGRRFGSLCMFVARKR